MLQKMQGMPPYVAAFKATGEVSKEDYERLLEPEIERVDKEHGHIHFLMVMENSAKDFSLGAWFKDAAEGLKHYRGWKKVAIVTDEKGLEKFSNIFSAVIPGSSKGFPLAELEQAKQWVVSE
ncbi:MAG: STAS/SEC14 domain-containing protein [Flavisolibacter sp.]